SGSGAAPASPGPPGGADAASGPPTSSATWPPRFRTIPAWAEVNRADTPLGVRRKPAMISCALSPPPTPSSPSSPGSAGTPAPVLVHRGLHAVALQRFSVSLHGLAGCGGDHGRAFVVHVEHELLGSCLRVAEHFLEHIGDIRHEVDRIIPDDRHPGRIGHRVL